MVAGRIRTVPLPIFWGDLNRLFFSGYPTWAAMRIAEDTPQRAVGRFPSQSDGCHAGAISFRQNSYVRSVFSLSALGKAVCVVVGNSWDAFFLLCFMTGSWGHTLFLHDRTEFSIFAGRQAFPPSPLYNERRIRLRFFPLWHSAPLPSIPGGGRDFLAFTAAELYFSVGHPSMILKSRALPTLRI